MARLVDLETDELKKLNPAYSSKVTTGRTPIPAGYWVYLPAGVDLAILENGTQQKHKESMPPLSPAMTEERNVEKINPASTPTAPIAKEKVTAKPTSPLSYRKPEVIPDHANLVAQPVYWPPEKLTNNITSPEIIKEIQQNLQRKLSMTDDHIYVFANETLGQIADWLRLPVSHLQELNQLGRKKPFIRDKNCWWISAEFLDRIFYQKRLNFHLHILNGFFEEKVFVNCQEVRINAGESLWNIARNQYGVPMEIVQYFNMDIDFNRLYPGDILRIPVFQTHKSLEETL